LGGAQQAGNTSRRSTRNYEVDRTISHIKAAGGQIQRLSVAVVLNYKAQEVDAPPPVPGEEAPEAAEATMEMLPVTPEEIAQVEQIVREAVGIDAGRGDSVSISSAQFQTFVPGPIEEPGFMDSLSDFTGAAKMAGGFIAIMALIFGVLRPMLRSLVSASAEAVIANAQPRYVNSEGQAYDAQGQPLALQDGGQYPAQVGGPNGVAGSSMPRQSYDQQLGRARAMVQEDPERVAGVLKDWVAADA